MVVKAERPMNDSFQRLLGVELNCLILSHKWDSSLQRLTSDQNFSTAKTKPK